MNPNQTGQRAFPKLRADLIISRQETVGAVAWVVKDPVVGRFVRFKEPEYFIAQQLDGTTSPDEIRKRVEAHFGSLLSADALKQFVRKLQTLGLTDHPGLTPCPVKVEQRATRVRGNVFALRLKVFDPDRFLGALAPRLAFVFTPFFAGCSLCLIALGAAVMVACWQELHRSFAGLYRV